MRRVDRSLSLSRARREYDPGSRPGLHFKHRRSPATFHAVNSVAAPPLRSTASSYSVIVVRQFLEEIFYVLLHSNKIIPLTWKIDRDAFKLFNYCRQICITTDLPPVEELKSDQTIEDNLKLCRKKWKISTLFCRRNQKLCRP